MSVHNNNNNFVYWFLDIIADKFIGDSQHLLQLSWSEFNDMLLADKYLSKFISNMIARPINVIQYLTDTYFIESWLGQRLDDPICVNIFMGINLDTVIDKIKSSENYDPIYITLMVRNSRVDLAKLAIGLYHKVGKTICLDQLLHIAAEVGCDDLYFYLIEMGAQRQQSIYSASIKGGSIKIVSDVNTEYGFNSVQIKSAFEHNNTDILQFMLCKAIDDKQTKYIKPEYLTYAVMNSNIDIINWFENNKMAVWQHDLFYSALLSGNISTVRLIESKFVGLHENNQLDNNRMSLKVGKRNLLIDEITYKTINNSTKFSHVMDYAVKSKSIEMLSYVYSLSYGITLSNVINAIRQSNNDVLEWVCKTYGKKLPTYVIHYVGLFNCTSDKATKCKIIHKYTPIDFNFEHSVTYYKIESTHIQLIRENCQIVDISTLDADHIFYLDIFYNYVEKSNTMQRLFSTIRYLLWVDDLTQIKHHIDKQKQMKFHHDIHEQMISDCVFMFGTLNQIKQLKNYLLHKPSINILNQLALEYKLNVLIYIYSNYIYNDTVSAATKWIKWLNDDNLNKISKMIN